MTHAIIPKVGQHYLVNGRHYRCTAISNQANIETAERQHIHNPTSTFIHLRELDPSGQTGQAAARFYNCVYPPSWFEQDVQILLCQDNAA